MLRTTKKLFIGSSTNALPIANEIKVIISANFPNIEIEIWNETEWKNLVSVLDNLIEKIEEYYYAIFVGFPDDKIVSGTEHFFTTRDNVTFEFGLFLSRLNKDRTFLLIPELTVLNTYPFKLLSDIGNSTVVDKYRLGQRDNEWTSINLKEDLKKLIKRIQGEEKRIQEFNSQTGKKIKNISSSLHHLLEQDGKTDEYYISLFKNSFDDLVRLISIETNRAIHEIIEDVLLVSTNIEDILNTKQLAEKQSYELGISEVWVFADEPLEFLKPDSSEDLKILQKTIVDNLGHGVKYHYFVNDQFKESAVQEFLKRYPNHLELIKNICMHKIDRKYFKTYFTLHFSDDRRLCEIYLSALMQNRKDILIKVSKEHQNRIFDTIERIIGKSGSVDGVNIKHYT